MSQPPIGSPVADEGDGLNSWIAVASGSIGVLLGVVGKYVADVRIGHRSRLFDEKLRAAFRFLDAVEDYDETITKNYSAKFRLKYVEGKRKDKATENADQAYAVMRDAFKAARQAETALVLLMPAIEATVVAYLTAVVRYAWHEVEYSEVSAARKVATEDIRRALGVRERSVV